MDKKIIIELDDDEALVLFDWITRFNEKESNEFEDQAEERVLWNLEALLKKKLVASFTGEYEALIAEARDRIRDSE